MFDDHPHWCICLVGLLPAQHLINDHSQPVDIAADIDFRTLGLFRTHISVCPDLPVEVDILIKTALAKDRNKRYATTVDLAKALNLIAFGNEGSITFDTNSGGRSEAYAGQSSRGRMGALVVGIILFIAVVGFFLLRNQLSIAERPTATPSLTPTLVTVTVPPTLTTTATLEVATQSFAPSCSENLIVPTPFVKETNYVCLKRRPYTTITIPEGATFEVTDPQASCISEATSRGRTVLSCSGPSFLEYDLKVCVPPVIENSDLNKCSQGDTFDSTNQCCIAVPPEGAGCTIFVVKLKGC